MPKRDTRIALKHDIEANWNKAINFIPMMGEVIIYDPDQNYSYPRIKVGNGIDIVPMLPFLNEPRGQNYVWKKYTFAPILAQYKLGDDLDKNYLGLVYNTDRNAFPDDGDFEGYWYVYLGTYEEVATGNINGQTGGLRVVAKYSEAEDYTLPETLGENEIIIIYKE